MKKIQTYISLLLIATLALKAQGQEGITQLKNFRYGKLGNGFSYFIKHLEEPQKKTSMRFYIKAGYNQEDIDQLQLAHLLEHVVFKPTENFPYGIKKEILNVNMNNGDIGGATGFKSTRYSFDAPSQNKQAIKLGLKWFKEIAAGLKLTDKSIVQERGAVKQEFIFGSRDGLQDYYAERNLVSKLFPCRSSFDSFLNHIQTFPNENLRRFYKEWYRPDLMGVMIVGNIQDMQAMEQFVKSIFKDIPKQHKPRKKINCDSLYFARPPQFVVEELKGGTKKIQAVEYRLVFRQPELAQNRGTKKGYKRYVAFQLFLEVIRDRFQQKKIANGLSFRIIVKNSYKYGPAPFAYTILFKPEEQFTQRAFQYVFTTLQQFRKHGILEEEWKKVKEKYRANKVKKDERYWQKQLSNYFVKEEALFGNKQEVLQQWVQELSVDDFNELIHSFLVPMPEDIGIIAPTGSKALQYTGTQVRTWIKQSNQQPVSAYRLPEITHELLNPKEVAELEKGKYTDHGWKKNSTKEIVLSNGVKVVLKPYQPTKGIGADQISIHGYSKTGAACFPKSDYYSALNAPSIVEHTGVGGFSDAQIRSFKKIANISSCTPYIGYKESGIHGIGGLANIQELLQLVYLYYAQPNCEVQLVEKWKKGKSEVYHTIGKDISQDFKNKIRHFFGDSTLPPTFGYRYLKSTEAYNSIKKTNGKRGFEIYQQIFGQPQSFTFIITGNFKINNVLPLIRKYLGNLPQGSNMENCGNPSKTVVPIKNGPVYKEFITDRYKMESVKYKRSYIVENDENNSWKKTLKIKVFGELVDRMLKRLRYKKGFAVYNFGAAGRYNPDQDRYKITFDITCQREEFKPIQEECQKIIQEIKNGQIKETDFQQAVKKIRGRYAKQTLLQHRNMQKLLYEQLRYDKPWVGLGQYDKFLRSLDIKDMVKMANKYFQKEYQYEFVMCDQLL